MSEEFGVLNLDEYQEEGKRLNTKNSNENAFMDMYVPMPEVKAGQKGLVTVRILPPRRGEKLYVATRLHSINGRKYHCPKPLMNGKWDRNTNCPVCNYYSSLWSTIEKLEKSGQLDLAKAKKDEARAIKPIERYYYNAIVREMIDSKGVKQVNVGPRILSVGKILHQMIVRAIVGDEVSAAIGDVTHPVRGFDFTIIKELQVSGGEEFPSYNRSTFARDPSPLGTPEEIQKWAATLHDLKSLRSLKAISDLENEIAIHRGLIPDKKDSFNVEEFDAKYRTATKSTESTSVPSTSVANVDDMVESLSSSIDPDEFMAELNAM